MNLLRRKSEASYSIGNQCYRGRVSRHQTLIKREPEGIYNVLTDPDRLKQWAPFEEITVEKITAGEFGIGTRLHFKLQFKIEPEWDSEVIHLEKNRQIVYQFLNGIFDGGMEVWDLKKTESGTEVTHTLVYKIDRWTYKIGWYLLGGVKKHDELTETALHRLKSLLESA